MIKNILKSFVAVSVFATLALAQVNINTATKEELMSLKGLGPSKAESIIKYRQANKFQEPKDIIKVKGIGEKLYKGFKDEISVTGKTVVEPKVSKKAKEKIKDTKQEVKSKASTHKHAHHEDMHEQAKGSKK